MRFNWGLFFFALILIAGAFGVVKWKLLDDPIKRFHKTAMADPARREGTLPSEYYYLGVFQATTGADGKTHTYLLDDFILNPAQLDTEKDFYIGRLYGSPKDVSLKGKIRYRFQNKDLLFGVQQGRGSSLGHRHLTLRRAMTQQMGETIQVFSDHDNGLYFVTCDTDSQKTDRKTIDEDLSALDSAQFEIIPKYSCIVLSDYSSVILRAGKGIYLKFYRINGDESMYVRQHTVQEYYRIHAKNEKKRLIRRGDDGTVPSPDDKEAFYNTHKKVPGDDTSDADDSVKVFVPQQRNIRR